MYINYAARMRSVLANGKCHTGVTYTMKLGCMSVPNIIVCIIDRKYYILVFIVLKISPDSLFNLGPLVMSRKFNYNPLEIVFIETIRNEQFKTTSTSIPKTP